MVLDTGNLGLVTQGIPRLCTDMCSHLIALQVETNASVLASRLAIVKQG